MHYIILVRLTGGEGLGLCPLSPEPAIDGAAYPGWVVGVGKQMFQVDFADLAHIIAAQLLHTHRQRTTKQFSKMSNFYFCGKCPIDNLDDSHLGDVAWVCGDLTEEVLLSQVPLYDPGHGGVRHPGAHSVPFHHRRH